MPETPPQTAAEWRGAGADHYRAGRLAEAETATRASLRLEPRDTAALANLGAILRAQRRPLEALETLDRALAIAPGEAFVLVNHANVLNELQRFAEAFASADRALAIVPDHALAHLARGNALAGLGRRPEAVADFRECLRLSPDNASARFNLAAVLVAAGDADQALAVYDAAIASGRNVASAYAERGHLLARLERWAGAAEAYDRACDLDPGQPYLAGQRLHARMKICDWRDFDRLAAELGARIDAGELAAIPFPVAAMPLTAAQQLRCARTYAAATLPVLPRPAAPPPSPRIRLGYFSADFHEHATAFLIAEALELHDRSAFEVTVFSFGPSDETPMRTRLKAACEHFLDVADLDPAAIARLAALRGLDIAVDLKGLTGNSRAKIFAVGAAPVQVSFLGYPMTTGAACWDYLIADRVLIGPEDVGDYSEKVAWLPNSYQPNDRKRLVAAEPTTRADHGLSADAFVFASFNGSYKITPTVFALWMDLLKAAPGSVLWLLRDAAAGNLRRAAGEAGLDPARLVFAPTQPAPRHRARIARADLFLDSLPCGAHTTASDALWAGLPLITCRGATFAGRVAASLLTAAGLPDLIVESLADYRALALGLARDAERLGEVRARVAAARTSALFDTPAYVRDLEGLYRRMHERRLRGLPPDHLP
ncbi:tetratricopeptide repeat protein [Phenylobacterium sp.]|uniref:O-linked N-acetylglucosamine transferase, SPINDLY family protein n=1 Tax=Phenylobacterium sp. TaxID=1871053 RepID=UPI00120EA922|nr:tetratricopeptide repeat protein [Phenylobacterium sp.]THD62036.1 MAG: tetratricopeptide repeat protein [Phenylobacterium sp.]